jgi:hypothetical protein
MAITTAQGPAGGAAIVADVVATLMTSGPGALSPKGGKAPSSYPGTPLPLFVLQLQDIVSAGSKFMDKVIENGWRYVIVSDGQVKAVADVKGPQGGQPPQFSALTHGELAERLAQASELAANNFADDPAGNFEARVLEIPALYIEALWLHGSRDIFIPFLEGARDRQQIQEDPSFLTRVSQMAQSTIQAVPYQMSP